MHFHIYAQMHTLTNGKWDDSRPQTNVMWLTCSLPYVSENVG
jgi:hypothetical protein